MAPPSQKYRQIGFYLSGGTSGSVYLALTIRPEELTRTEPSRLAVQQTVGGVWADAHDRGVSTIQLKGHTGWRGSPFLSGEALFHQLRTTVFTDWHARRQAAANAGIDPATVELIYVDALDSITAVVAPKQFLLQRSSKAPLLFQYTIDLMVLADALPAPAITDPITDALASTSRWLDAVSSLTSAVTLMSGMVGTVAAAVGTMTGTVTAFVSLGTRLLGLMTSTVQAARGTVDGATAHLLPVALAVSAAGRAAFSVLAAADLPVSDKAALMTMARLFGDAHCALVTGIGGGLRAADYADLFGASNCSSTGGGRSWSTFTEQWKNPFDSLFQPVSSSVIVSADAQSALQTLRRDPLALAAEPALVVGCLGTIVEGVDLP